MPGLELATTRGTSEQYAFLDAGNQTPLSYDAYGEIQDRYARRVRDEQKPRTQETALAGLSPESRLEQILSTLEQAASVSYQNKPGAALALYHQAILLSDILPHDQIKADAQALSKQLTSGRISGEQRRRLEAKQAELALLERLPGITRANLGLAYINAGQEMEGINMLLLAGQIDPEMVQDASYQKHLRQAFQHSAEGARETSSRQPAPGDLVDPTWPSGPKAPSAPEAPATPDSSVDRTTGLDPLSTQTDRGIPQPTRALSHFVPPDLVPAAEPPANPAPPPVPPSIDQFQPADSGSNSSDSTSTRSNSGDSTSTRSNSGDSTSTRSNSGDSTSTGSNSGDSTSIAGDGGILSENPLSMEELTSQIQKVDQVGDPAKILPQLREILAQLESGKRKLPTGMVHNLKDYPDELTNLHDAATQMIMVLHLRSEYRYEYANMLKAQKRYADAEKQLKDARDLADQIPADLVRKERDFLLRDSSNSNLSKSARQQLKDAADQMDKVSKWSAQIRYAMANFYLAGATLPNGKPNEDAVTINGHPGTAHLDVLQPEKAKVALDQIVDLQKSSGTALLPDHYLTLLQAVDKANSAEQLHEKADTNRKEYQHLWSMAGSTLLGVGATALLLDGQGLAAQTLFSSAGLLAVGGGLAVSTGSNMGLERLLFKDPSYTWKDAIIRGGGSYLAAEALIYGTNSWLDAKFGGYTQARTGAMAYNLLPQSSTVGDLANLYKGAKLAVPTALAEAVADGASTDALTPETTAELMSASGSQAADLLSKLFPDAQGLPLDAAASVAEDAADSSGVSTAVQTSRMLSPFKALIADHIPTPLELRVSRAGVYYGSAVAYNTLLKALSGTAAMVDGRKDANGRAITPWGLLAESATASSYRNLLVQSAGTALLIGAGIGNSVTAENAASENLLFGQSLDSLIPGRVSQPIGAAFGAMRLPLFSNQFINFAQAFKHKEDARQYQHLFELTQHPVSNAV